MTSLFFTPQVGLDKTLHLVVNMGFARSEGDGAMVHVPGNEKSADTGGGDDSDEHQYNMEYIEKSFMSMFLKNQAQCFFLSSFSSFLLAFLTSPPVHSVVLHLSMPPSLPPSFLPFILCHFYSLYDSRPSIP